MTKTKIVKDVAVLEKAALKNRAKRLRKKAKKALAVSIVKGNGDYIPNRFARVRGKGGYFSDLIGGAARGLGNSVLPGLGDLGVNLFKGITGMGDYRERVKQHQRAYTDAGIEGAYVSAFSNPQPMKMGNMNAKFGGGPPVVSHREFIGQVLGSANFATTAYRIQPGLRGVNVMFPWGSSVANCFQQYELEGAILEYVSTSTNYASTTQLGSVMMSTQYDANATPLSSQQAIDNAEFTTTDSPDKSFIHPIECSSKESPTVVRYVRSNNTVETSSTDDRLDDVGVFQISTIGNTSADGVQIGELWITYKIKFLKPALPDIHSGTTFLGNYTSTGVGEQPFFGTAIINSSNSLPLTTAGTGVNLPVGYAGSYQVTLFISNLYSGTVIPTWGTDVTPLSLWHNGSSYNESVGATGASVLSVFTFSTIAETVSNNYIIFDCTVASGAIVTLLVTAMDNDITNDISFSRKQESREVVILHDTVALLRKEIDNLKLRVDATTFIRRNSEADDAKENELEKSVHIPKNVLTEYLRKL